MGSSAELALELTAKNAASRELQKVSSSIDGVDDSAKRATGGGLKNMAGLMVGGLAVGIGAVVAGLGAAAQAAAEEAVGVERMTAALKANVKGFDGNTAAIEETIAKRQQLSFADDVLRDSLTTIVTKTHDVTAALDIQRVAMDVARLKNTDLASASDLVLKAMEGNSKALKQLGLSDLPATATAQERLAAVQKAAAGQAEAYAKTAVGAQERFGNAVGDLVEDLGEIFLPILTEIAVFLADTLVPAIRTVIGNIKDWIKDNKPLVDAIKNGLGLAIGFVVGVLGKMFEALGKIISWFTSNKTLMRGIELAFKAVGDTITAIVDGLRAIIRFAEAALRALSKVGGAEARLRGTNANSNYFDVPGSASGGWVGLAGPEIRMVGEKGPEYVVPNHQLGSMGGVTIQGVSEQDLIEMIDRGLYFRLQRAAATAGRA